VKDLFPCCTPPSFGPNALERSTPAPSVQQVRSPRVSGLRVLVRQECPRRAGVYGMLNDRGELIYVGKAKCLRSRLLSYFRVKGRDPKAGRIIRDTKTLVWENAPSEFAALLRELQLIRRWRPRFNVQGQPKRRRPLYVCLGHRPAPHAFLSRFPTAGSVACFGPVPAARAAWHAVRFLNDWFQLQDCPSAQEMIFADQPELFPVVRAAGCLRYEIGTCLGPCLGACMRRDYLGRVRAAQGFLAGTNLGPLDAIKRQMSASATALEFERAAALRDRLEALTWLHERLKHLRQARQRQSFIYPVQGHAGTWLWYLIQHGYVVAAMPAPLKNADRKIALAQLRRVYKKPAPAPGAVPASEIDGVLLVAAWFRRHPEERARTIKLADAVAACKSVGCGPPLSSLSGGR
jgi:excinuclease ABC subunit C